MILGARQTLCPRGPVGHSPPATPFSAIPLKCNAGSTVGRPSLWRWRRAQEHLARRQPLAGQRCPCASTAAAGAGSQAPLQSIRTCLSVCLAVAGTGVRHSPWLGGWMMPSRRAVVVDQGNGQRGGSPPQWESARSRLPSTLCEAAQRTGSMRGLAAGAWGAPALAQRAARPVPLRRLAAQQRQLRQRVQASSSSHEAASRILVRVAACGVSSRPSQASPQPGARPTSLAAVPQTLARSRSALGAGSGGGAAAACRCRLLPAACASPAAPGIQPPSTARAPAGGPGRGGGGVRVGGAGEERQAGGRLGPRAPPAAHARRGGLPAGKLPGWVCVPLGALRACAAGPRPSLACPTATHRRRPLPAGAHPAPLPCRHRRCTPSWPASARGICYHCTVVHLPRPAAAGAHQAGQRARNTPAAQAARSVAAARAQVHTKLASERAAREAAYKEKALIQIELEAKQRLAFAMREVGAGGARPVGRGGGGGRWCARMRGCRGAALPRRPARLHACTARSAAAAMPERHRPVSHMLPRRRRRPRRPRWRRRASTRRAAAATTLLRCSACWMRRAPRVLRLPSRLPGMLWWLGQASALQALLAGAEAAATIGSPLLRD